MYECAYTMYSCCGLYETVARARVHECVCECYCISVCGCVNVYVCARVCAEQLIMNAFGSEKSANRSAGKWTPVVGDVSRRHPRTSCGVPSAVNPHHMALIAIVSRVVIATAAATAAASEVETSVSRAHKYHWFGRCTAFAATVVHYNINIVVFYTNCRRFN